MVKDRRNFCITRPFGYTQEQNLVQNILGGCGWGGGNDSALKSGAPDVLFLSDSCGQVSLVDKQISGDAANLPVLTNSECDGTAMFCNMWYVSVKWKVCHT